MKYLLTKKEIQKLSESKLKPIDVIKSDNQVFFDWTIEYIKEVLEAENIK